MDNFSGHVKGSLKDLNSIIPISVQSKEKSKRLKDQVKDLQTQNSTLQTEHNKYLNKINEESSVSTVLQQEAHMLKRFINDKDIEIAQLNGSVKELNEVVQALKKEKAIKEQDLERLMKQMEEKQKLEEKMTANINDLNGILEKEMSKTQQLSREIEENKEKYQEDIKEIGNSHQAQITEKERKHEEEIKEKDTKYQEEIREKENKYQEEIKEKENKYQEEIKEKDRHYEEEIKQKREELEKLNTLIVSKESEIEQMKKEMDQVQEQQLKLVNEIHEFQINVNSLTQMTQNQASEINDLKESLIESKENANKLSGELSELKEKHEASEKELASLEERYQQSQSSLQSEQSALAQIQSEARKLESDLTELRLSVNQMTQELSIKSQQNEELFQIRANLNMEIECVRKSHLKEMEDLTSQLTTLQERSETDQKELQSKQSEIEKLTADNQSLSGQLEQSKESNDKLSQENEKNLNSIKEMEEKIQDRDGQITKLNRSLEVTELERNSLKSENETIKSMINTESEGQGKVLDVLDSLRKDLNTHQLSIIEKNTLIQERESTITQLNEQIQRINTELAETSSNLAAERDGRASDVEALNKRIQQIEQDFQANLEKTIKDFEAKVQQITEEKDSIQKEANNLAQRLSNELDKSQGFEVQIKHYQRELESANTTRDNLVKEIQELQESKLVDGANKDTETKILKELNDFKAKSTEEFEKIHQERVQWETIKKEIQAQLLEEKNKSKVSQDQLVETKRTLGVIEKIISKLLEQNEDQKFESMSPETFYAMVESVKNELTQTLSHRRQYYDDEDLLGQLIMEREARKLAESQVLIVLEKSRSEINKYKEIIQNGLGNNNNNNNKSGFFSNFLKSFDSPQQSQSQNNNFLKRTFTGTNYPTKK